MENSLLAVRDINHKYIVVGRIKGAVIKGRTWLIPESAIKPEDPRKSSNVTNMK